MLVLGLFMLAHATVVFAIHWVLREGRQGPRGKTGPEGKRGLDGACVCRPGIVKGRMIRLSDFTGQRDN